jgi:putative protein-disulfide isomerase
MQNKTLYYINDPMCSWCYAFSLALDYIILNLPKNIKLEYICGGLAQHSDKTMPISMQNNLQNTWHTITQQVGSTFNHDFWTKNTPRRSTYLACQAVICAREQKKELPMIKAIQKAYYLDAKNPSNEDTLLACASDIGLDSKQFKQDLYSSKIIHIFEHDLKKRRELHINSFPSLVLQVNTTIYNITLDFTNYKKNLEQILEK